ncbi:MAG: SUMF1/EgtB/PvdO family nonheme iron enzyme [Pirellulaceae bacterium]|nr:SUMF1/EgtB/PvdO family nonheme iron enzyme [Pirellulaceae bacterium]
MLRAFDEVLQRVVAIKVMAPQLAATSPARKRFLREARSSAQVRHENVVQVYDVKERPLPFLVMEYIPGETLQDRLDRIGPLEVQEVLQIGRQIAEGLAAAHAKDLIHRDIKPGNVLLEGDQHKVKITDFGLARAADDASMTQSGMIAGTPLYMAPEQALGHTLDQRADLFSLGSVLYQMVTGRPPFRANSTIAVLKRVVDDTPRDMREVIPETPAWLCDIIAKLHAKDPENRYQSAREVAEVLADCEEQLKLNTRLQDYSRIPKQQPVSPVPMQGSPSTTRGRVAAGSAVLILLPLVALAISEITGITTFFRGHAVTPVVDEPSIGTIPVAAVQTSPEADGWVQLFNGQDLTGWKIHPEQPGSWEVTNGILVGHKLQSHLFSERADFANFHLRAEVKLNQGGDSGIRFRAPFALTRGKEAWQVQPAGGYEAEFNRFPGSPTHTGSVQRANPPLPPSKLFRAEPSLLVLPDEWATYEVIADGNRIITKLNGQEVANCVDPDSMYSRGHIALQCFHSNTVVQYRKIEIKELPPSPSPSVAPPLAIAPFDAAQARAHQEAWAKHLGVPVEHTNTVGMKFSLIPPGEFMMGATEGEIKRALVGEPPDWFVNRVNAEGPQRRTTVPAPFYLGQLEVTLGQFRQFVRETGYRTTAETNGKGGTRLIQRASNVSPENVWSSPTDSPTEDHPVVFVSIEDARQFCTWLGKKDGRTYALPRDDQWEFACRAGTTTPWFSGDDKADALRAAWVAENSGGQLQPGGRKDANAFGLRDMLGNVEEICEAVPPQVPTRRGGGAQLNIDACRSSSRGMWKGDSLPWYRGGFRVAIIDPKPATSLPTAAPPSPTFTNSIGMEFVIVPKGKSWLGGGKDKLGDQEVEIPTDFYLGKYEVTQGEWERVMGTNPSWFSRNGDGASAVKDISDADLRRLPVENVSWDQCQLFVAKLNAQEQETGWVYRLPSETQWEYACRGGPMSESLDSAFGYYFAKPTNTLLPEQANFGGENGLNRTCNVGAYEANVLGLCDMHGNVWEWCENADKVADSTSFRAGKGGAWHDPYGEYWAASRPTWHPSHRERILGLRLARVPSSALSTTSKTPPLDGKSLTEARTTQIASLPAEQQVEEVRRELMRLNPGFDGKFTPTIENGAITQLSLNTDEVLDISPVWALTKLVYLDLRGTYPNKGKLSDLSPLSGMAISRLDCSSTQIADLSPLAGLPLTHLHFNHNPVSDLAPLKGMPLEELGLAETKVSDLSPLAGMKIKVLGAQLLPVTDLSPLAGMPLTGLDLYHTIGVTSLEPLRGMPLEGLNLQDVPVADLSPLAGLTTLRTLHLQGNKVSDLSPLAGLKLTDLLMFDEQITDLSPLKDLPLQRLIIHSTGVSDLRPLEGMPLVEIRLKPKNITQGLDVLREIKTLQTIGIDGNRAWPPAEFWERYDRGEFAE